MEQQKVMEESRKTAQAGGAAGAAKNPPATDKVAESQKKYVSSLESRALMRALESYGHNYPYIQSVVLPVFGNTGPEKSLPQVRARCHQMIRSIMASASATIPKRVLASWVPKEVFTPPPPTTPENKKKARKQEKRQSNKVQARSSARGPARSTPAPPVEGTRRSSRHQKHRQLMDL